MDKFETQADEVVLYRSNGISDNYEGELNVVLTSLNLYIQNNHELLETIPLNSIKVFKGVVYAKHSGHKLEIQSTLKSVSLEFKNGGVAKAFEKQILNIVTNTTTASRNEERIKKAFFKTTSAVDGAIGEIRKRENITTAIKGATNIVKDVNEFAKTITQTTKNVSEAVKSVSGGVKEFTNAAKGLLTKKQIEETKPQKEETKPQMEEDQIIIEEE